VAQTPARDEALSALRVTFRDTTRRATTVGYGPRFLHSTGQLHKGGAPIGWFLQLISEHPDDRAIPGKAYSFGAADRRPGARRREHDRRPRPADPAPQPGTGSGRRASPLSVAPWSAALRRLSQQHADEPAPAPAPPPPARTMPASFARRRPLPGRRSRPTPDVNPLREGLRLERVPDPCAFVLFGATGDLAHRKVMPAIYQLWRTNLLPAEFSLVAVARRPYTNEAFAPKFARRSRSTRASSRSTRRLGGAGQTHHLSATRLRRRRRLRPPLERLDELDAERGTAGNRLFYLATQPSQVTEIVRQMGRVGLDHELRGGAGVAWSSRSRSAATTTPRDGSTTRSTRSSASRRSTASTTTWARKRSATCWSSASATASSSRSGTAATWTTSRSPWPSRSASKVAAPSTRRPAPAATSSRTISCS
jgi:hypothetical protein